jgi:hypothetical protein
MKIRPVEAEFFHTDGQTDVTKLIVDFRKSAGSPKMIFSSSIGFQRALIENNISSFIRS